MCCDGWEPSDEPVVGECPACGALVDADGYTVDQGCNYSPSCRICGDAPCDGSC